MFRFPPRRIAGALAAVLLAASLAQPALARDTYVEDGAGLFGAATISNLNGEIGDFNRQTGKEIVVVTVPSLDGQTLNAAAEATFAKDQVNGVLFFFAKAEKQDVVVGDTASRAFFPAGTFANIHAAMRGYLRSGDFDQALTTGVNLVLDQYRGHQRPAAGAAGNRTAVAPTSRGTSYGGGMSLIWLGLILFAGFLIIRGIFRALAGPRMMPPGYGSGPPASPGYGGSGYGGYPGPGGGAGFFSGLLGGLGGAWLGNELFGHQQWGGGIGQAGMGDAGNADASGWQSDPGQADIGNAGGGSWGDSGGGFDPGGGFGGDSGGGFGGDGGGGW